jgi:hypothetical protein
VPFSQNSDNYKEDVMNLSRAILRFGSGVCLCVSLFSTQQLVAQTGSANPVFLEAISDASDASVAQQMQQKLAEQPVERSLDELIADGSKADKGIRETRIQLKILADRYAEKIEESQLRIEKQKQNLSKLKPLLDEASSTGKIEKNGRSISIDKLKLIADRTVAALKKEQGELRRKEVITKKLQEFYNSLNTAYETHREVCKSAGVTMEQIRQSVVQSGYDRETAYLHTQRYLNDGIRIDSSSHEVSTNGRVPVKAELAKMPNANLVSVTGELTELADKLDANGQSNEAASLRAQVSKLQQSK